MKRSSFKHRGKPLRRGQRLQAKTRMKPRNAKRKGHLFPKNVDKEYRAWIRGHACCIAVGIHWLPSFTPNGGKIHAAHVKSRGAGGPDHGNLVPLCGDHHAEQHHIGIRSFEERYRVNLQAEADAFWARYVSRGGDPE